MWKITDWVDTYNSCKSCIGNNKRNLNSATIISYILHLIEKDVEYQVKQIQENIAMYERNRKKKCVETFC